MPFFIQDKKKTNKKRKAEVKKSGKKDLPKAKKSKKIEDEDITSEEEDNDEKSKGPEKDASSDEDETPEETRKRIAEKILAEKAALNENEDAEQLSELLRQEHRERIGWQFKTIADQYEAPSSDDVTWCRWCKLDSVTCIAVTPDGTAVFSGSKDGTIVKWNSTTGEKLHVIHGLRKKKASQKVGHMDEVLALAISYDGKFLVSGGKDKLIHVWNPKDCQHIHTLCSSQGHQSAIVSLAFRDDSHQLFSCSARVSNSAFLRVWDLDEMGLMDHMPSVDLTDVDCLKHNNPVTACGQASNILLWKLDKGTVSTFSGRQGQQNNASSRGPRKPIDSSSVHCAAIDCVRYIDDQHIISGASDNSLAVWKLSGRFPLATVTNAHNGGASDRSVESWITAVASFRRSDLIASGSHDGFLRFWKCGAGFRSLDPIFSVPVGGFINGLQFSTKADFIAVGVGKQHRRGRWFSSSKNSTQVDGQTAVQNGVCIIQLKKKNTLS